MCHTLYIINLQSIRFLCNKPISFNFRYSFNSVMNLFWWIQLFIFLHSVWEPISRTNNSPISVSNSIWLWWRNRFRITIIFNFLWSSCFFFIYHRRRLAVICIARIKHETMSVSVHNKITLKFKSMKSKLR